MLLLSNRKRLFAKGSWIFFMTYIQTILSPHPSCPGTGLRSQVAHRNNDIKWHWGRTSLRNPFITEHAFSQELGGDTAFGTKNVICVMRTCSYSCLSMRTWLRQWEIKDFQYGYPMEEKGQTRKGKRNLNILVPVLIFW